jgi:Mob1/phocein family
VVKLPAGENMNDWLAVHVVDFFNRINLIYGTVSEYCTETTCPKMSGGSRYEYFWADGDKFKKPTALPAPKYIENLIDWVEGQINNDEIFPITTDIPWVCIFVSRDFAMILNLKLFTVSHAHFHRCVRRFSQDFSEFSFTCTFTTLTGEPHASRKQLKKSINLRFPGNRRIVAIGAEPHVNTCFKHFYYFVTEFDLLPAKEMEPLMELVKQICKD